MRAQVQPVDTYTNSDMLRVFGGCQNYTKPGFVDFEDTSTAATSAVRSSGVSLGLFFGRLKGSPNVETLIY